MSRILYYLLIYPLSRLSLESLYIFSKPVYRLLYSLIGYRKALVRKQLQNSFPEKTKDELLVIEQGFYRHLTDLILEVICCFHISKEEVVRRGRLTNPEIFDKYKMEGKNLILVGGHYNNWELMAIALPAQVNYSIKGLYKPLSDRFMNEKMKTSRQKFGMELVTKSELKLFLASENQNPFAIIFGADQSPTHSKNVHWMDFLNQKTAVATGTEYFAKTKDLVVLYGAIHKKERGYYELTFIPITESPRGTQEGWITETHTRILESFIVQDPKFWIWTHNRWKRTDF